MCSIAQYFTSHASCKEKISVSHDWSNPSSSDFTRNRIPVPRISRGIETQIFQFHEESNPGPSDFKRNRIPDIRISRENEHQIFGWSRSDGQQHRSTKSKGLEFDSSYGDFFLLVSYTVVSKQTASFFVRKGYDSKNFSINLPFHAHNTYNSACIPQPYNHDTATNKCEIKHHEHKIKVK